MHFALKSLILIIPSFFVLSPLLLELSLLIVSFSSIYLMIEKKKFEFFNNFYFKIIFIFSIYLLLSLIFFHEVKIGYKYSIFYIRYSLYIISVAFLINHLNIKRELLISFLIVNLILIFDTFFQYIFGLNIIGYETADIKRISSFFGEELILGSFILKISPLVYSLFFFSEKKIDNKLIYFLPLIILLNLFVILLSGERAAFAMYAIFCFYLFVFLKIRLKTKFIFLIVTIVFSTFIFLFNPTIFERIINKTIYEVLGQSDSKEKYYNKNVLIVKDYYKKGCNAENEDFKIDCKYNKRLFIFSPTHNNYYITAINIFLDYKFFGSGPKSYRVLCNFEKYSVNSFSCATHPHNYYVQLLSETGIFGFIFILVLYLYFIYLFKEILFDKYSSIYSKNFHIILIGGMLVNLFPFIPTGNFFNNWISITIYFPIVYLIYDRNFR